MQIGIKHFFGWTVISAIPFGLVRTISWLSDQSDAAELPLMVTIYCSVGVTIALVLGGPLALACLAKSRAWLKISAALTWIVLLTIGTAQVMLFFWQSFGSGPPPAHTFYMMIGTFVGCFAAAILGNLLFLHLFGLQLLSVKARKAKNLDSMSLRPFPAVIPSVVDTPIGEAT